MNSVKLEDIDQRKLSHGSKNNNKIDLFYDEQPFVVNFGKCVVTGYDNNNKGVALELGGYETFFFLSLAIDNILDKKYKRPIEGLNDLGFDTVNTYRKGQYINAKVKFYLIIENEQPRLTGYLISDEV